MSLLFESILVENGELKNLELHQQRMQKSAWELFRLKKNWAEIFEIKVVKNKEKQKCKIFYDTKITSIEIEKYTPKKIKKIVPIIDNELYYKYKYANRLAIEQYTKNLIPGEEPIFIKNGLISDSSYSNLVFWNGNEWHTPKKPLLNGTRRQLLLHNKSIFETSIVWDDLIKYKKISFINALNDLGGNEIDL
ncbi:MAG: aminotransferase class IV [Chitinophagaceae bacterium]|nr:aminotransferase class IV [Chitinophagaceae bacterium]